MNKLKVEPDIANLTLEELQQLYMQRRKDARKGMKTLAAEGNDNCWDDLVVASQNLLPESERNLYSFGKFKMCGREILHHCRKWIGFQQKNGNVLPETESSLE